MGRVRLATLVGIAAVIVVLLAWPTEPSGSAWWVVTVGSNDPGFVPVRSAAVPRLGMAALRGDPLSTADRLRLGVVGLLAFALLLTVASSVRSPREV